jgi:predicted DCC family thiol-disulfide oxidoreductase YuxK
VRCRIMETLIRSRSIRLPSARLPSLRHLPRTFQSRYQSTSTHPPRPQAPLKVWWDSACPLCTREISLMKSLDSENRISFIPITKATSINNTCPIDKKTLLARFHAQEEGQDIVDGAAAFAAMWRQIPRLRWLGNAARNGVVLWVLERVYRGFLVVRPGLQWVLRRVEG